LQLKSSGLSPLFDGRTSSIADRTPAIDPEADLTGGFGEVAD
jgi:hypothetical protein